MSQSGEPILVTERVLTRSGTDSWSQRLSTVDDRGWVAGFCSLVLTAICAAAMFAGYMRSREMVTLSVNGSEWTTRTHQRTVDAFLREVGLDLQPGDIVLPDLGTQLETDQAIVVLKALPILVEAAGEVVEWHTHSRRVGDFLHEVGLAPNPSDVVILDNKVVDLDAPLQRYEWMPDRWPLLRGLLNRPTAPSWSWLKLQRAVQLSINDAGMHTTIETVARTVGEALLAQDIVLYLGDRVQPSLGTLLTTGMHVEILRAKPVTIEVDGRLVKTRTQARSVAQLLSEAGIRLLSKDYTVPDLDAEAVEEMSIRVVRVIEAWVWETEDIPYQTISRLDDTLELDQQRTDQSGSLGVRKRRVRIVYEDGEEKKRMVAEEWIERQPTTCIVSYGSRIVVREQQTPDGPIRYWRKIRMLATSYTPATCGKEPDHPLYGITRLGWKATKGIVAVDPRVINLLAEVYVPDYGFGTAGDTGGMINGRRIDLCYDEDNLVLWRDWVDVYLLEPVPPANEIDWILPNYPTPRR